MSNPWRPLLFALATAGLLRPLTAGLFSVRPLADPGPCVPPINASAPAGLRGYARFHANDSFIGRPVPCTRDQKICFQHNLIFNPELDRCEGVGPTFICRSSPNRTEFEHGSGQIIGFCKKYEDPCPGYRMAYDGRCYTKEIVRDVICGCDAKPTRHIMDSVECRSSPAIPIDIQQPEEESQCLIPDLRFPDVDRSTFRDRPSNISKIHNFTYYTPDLECGTQQAACFSQKKVFVSGYQGCYELLEKGPCPDEHLVAMDIEGTLRSRAEAVCVHERGGCPRGYKRMLFDGQCHEDRELELTAPGRLVRTMYGPHIVIFRFAELSYRYSLGYDGFCGVNSPIIKSIPRRPSYPLRGASNNLYEVENEPPKPEF